MTNTIQYQTILINLRKEAQRLELLEIFDFFYQKGSSHYKEIIYKNRDHFVEFRKNKLGAFYLCSPREDLITKQGISLTNDKPCIPINFSPQNLAHFAQISLDVVEHLIDEWLYKMSLKDCCQMKIGQKIWYGFPITNMKQAQFLWSELNQVIG